LAAQALAAASAAIAIKRTVVVITEKAEVPEEIHNARIDFFSAPEVVDEDLLPAFAIFFANYEAGGF
jgi:hypothetical protein